MLFQLYYGVEWEVTGNAELERTRKEKVVERFQVLEKNDEILSQYIRKRGKYYLIGKKLPLWRPTGL
jgi:adenylate kinase family enzyme